MARVVRIKGRDKFEKHFRQIEGLAKHKLKVGFFKSATYDNNQMAGRGKKRKGTLYVATVAAWNEFGTRSPDGSVHSPERPFFRNALKIINPKVGKMLVKAMRAGMIAKNFGKFFNAVGLVAQGEVQKSIRDLKTPPNAPATIKFKTVHGKEGNNPLIDTSTMVTSVTYSVSKL